MIGILINIWGINISESLIYSAILNGIITPLILILIVHISTNQKIMGRHKNNLLTNIVAIIGIMVTSISSVASIYLIFN